MPRVGRKTLFSIPRTILLAGGNMRKGLRWLVALLCLATMTTGAWAQVSTASLTGSVADPSGALIANAKVTLTDTLKGFKYSATSDASGRYLFRSLPPSTYSLTVQSSGFKTGQIDSITLNLDQNVSQNVTLQVGTEQQTVEVSVAGAAQVQTEDASTGQTIDRKFIDGLPLIGRQVYDLAYLAPGVSQPTGSTYGNVGTAAGNNFVSEGSRNGQSDILLDGISTTNYEQNTGFVLPLYTPGVDAVQEFKIQQTNFSAEYGMSGATVINVVTRSGTNKYHGSLFEYLRNTDFNSRNYFQAAQGEPTPPYHWNNFGGAVGGPVIKDKLFFFFDYAVTRTITPSSTTIGVPTAAERTGDFGVLCTGAGGSFNGAGQCSNPSGQEWDPYVINNSASNHVSTAFIPFNNMGTYASAGNPNTPWITPGVAGNLLNPVSLAVMKFLPLPNIAGGPLTGNWFGTGSNLNNNNQFDVKTDYRVTNNDLVSFKLSHGWGNSMAANILGNDFDANTQGATQNTVYSGALTWNHTFSPKTLFTLTGGYTHSWAHTKGIDPNFNPTSIGMPADLTTSGLPEPPAFQLDGYDSENGNATFGGQPWSGLLWGQDVGQIVASASHIIGNHELKFGIEWRLHRNDFTQYGLPAGRWEYQQAGTAQNSNSPGGTGGDAMASFLTGFATGWNAYEIPPSPATESFQYAGYVQDNWHVNSKLTLNLGLRYDLDMPRTERYNRMSYFDPNVASLVTGVTASPTCPACGNVIGSLEYVGGSNPSTPYNNYYAAIGPRLGLAYRLTDTTALRGGFGIYYDPSKGGAAGSGSGAAGFAGYDEQTNLAAYQGDNITPDAASVLGQNFGITPVQGNSQGAATFIGSSVNTAPVRTYNVLPREYSWSFGLEHELPWKLLVDAEYVGKKGTNLYWGGDTQTLQRLPASVAAAFIANPSAYQATVAIPADLVSAVKAVTPSYSNGIWGGTWPAYDGYLPYPQYPVNVWGSTGLSNVDAPAASSFYNGFELRVEKRFSQGLQFLGTYTNQKSTDDASIAGSNVYINGTAGGTLARVQDPNNLGAEHSLSQFDVSQIFQLSTVYELPYGHNRHWGSGANGFVDGALGGWQINGIYRWDTGQPLFLTLNSSTSLPTYGAQRPDLSAPLERASGTNINGYFANPQVVSQPAPFVDGNAPRVLGNIRAPGTNNLSASIFKNFPLGFREGAYLQFRAESFNTLNHVQFSAPNTTFGSSSFGVISSQANLPRELQLALTLYF
jgi:hypothetical protein